MAERVGAIKKEPGKDTDFVEINSSRYKLPISLPVGIYNILADITSRSVTSFKERQEASQKYYKMLEEAAAADAKLTPQQRKRREKQYLARKKKEEETRLEDTKKALEEMRKKGLL